MSEWQPIEDLSVSAGRVLVWARWGKRRQGARGPTTWGEWDFHLMRTENLMHDMQRSRVDASHFMLMPDPPPLPLGTDW
jgi:hypothetical protein